MNPLPREEHTVIAGRYYSNPNCLAASPNNNAAIVPVHIDPLQNNPMQVVNHGFEANYALQSGGPPQESSSSAQKLTQPHRRLSLLWKLNNNDQTKNLTKTIPGCRPAVGFQRNASCILGYMHSSSFAREDVDISHLENTEKQPSRRFSRRFANNDPSRLTQKKSVDENKEVFALFEDEFITFACRKENSLIHNNFMARAVANIGNKVMQGRHRY